MLFPLVLVGIAVLLIIVQDYVRKSSRTWKLLNKFPGDKPLPLIGNALQIGFNSDETCAKLMQMWHRHGQQTFRVTMGTENWVMLCEPDDIRIILSHPTELSKPLERNAAFKPFFGNSVSTAEGEKWKSTRKLIVSSFSFKTLDQRQETINKYCDQLAQIFDRYKDKKDVDLYRYLKPFMLDLMCDSFMGVERNFLQNVEHRYFKTGKNIIKILTNNYFNHWRIIESIFVWTPMYKEMTETIKNIRDLSQELIYSRKVKTHKNSEYIDEIEEEKKKNAAEDLCLLDKFLNSKLPNGEPVPDSQINEEISLLCFTAHYTTTVTMSHALYLMAKYPEVQQKAYEEQMMIFGEDKLRKATNDDLGKMKYLEAVVKETFRVLPTVTKIGRQLQEDLTLSDGRVVPAGTSVVVFYEAMNMNPKLFPEPSKFDPERFYGNPASYIVPFSAGPRGCLGSGYAWMAMKSVMSTVLRRYKLSVAKEPDIAYRMLLESDNGINLKLSSRV
uniref:Cytochrome P450 CYP405A2 n=2 Tax=Zygaena filipendulae TaxID=287375 RepID=D2JLJ6_9NEOP|nr:cytochrome P450 CYP405A2 [Zygaena filipendulae]